jgi:hypothetical protein
MKEKRKDERKDERFDLCLIAKIGVVSKKEAEESKILILSTKDICLGGTFIPTPDPLPIGTEVRIQIVLPLNLKTIKEDQALLSVEKAVVLRQEPHGMAIAFMKGRDIILADRLV